MSLLPSVSNLNFGAKPNTVSAKWGAWALVRFIKAFRSLVEIVGVLGLQWDLAIVLVA